MSSRLSLASLESLVGERSPGVEEARLEAKAASAEVRQSHLYGNPTLDASWNTIPIGQTNPEDLSSPLANVPNYGVGVSYTFLVGKRGPRTDRAEALERAAGASLAATKRDQALELAHLLGGLATSKLKLEGMRGVLESGQREVELAEARLKAGFGTPLDVDRLRIEVSRTEQVVRAEESSEAAALASCSAYVGMPCRTFQDAGDARAFMESWFERAARANGPAEDRADLRALAAQEQAALHERRLARAQAIPDPTVRVGYVRDQFSVSGAQQNSLNLSVSMPLPFFDHGQAAAQLADAKREAYANQRQKALAVSRARVPALAARLEVDRARQKNISTDVMPRAQAVLANVDEAAERRLVSMADVIQARRAVSELLVEEADTYSDAFETALELFRETSSSRTESP